MIDGQEVIYLLSSKTVNESRILSFLESLFWRKIAEKVQDVFMNANIRL